MMTNPIGELATHMGNATVTQPVGIAAIALQMAIKYHDSTVIKDGALYQQYKLEGKNLRELHIDEVFETAIRIEEHLLTSERRIQEMVVDMACRVVEAAVTEADEEPVSHDVKQVFAAEKGE